MAVDEQTLHRGLRFEQFIFVFHQQLLGSRDAFGIFGGLRHKQRHFVKLSLEILVVAVTSEQGLGFVQLGVSGFGLGGFVQHSNFIRYRIKQAFISLGSNSTVISLPIIINAGQ